MSREFFASVLKYNRSTTAGHSITLRVKGQFAVETLQTVL
jgi:hypothetical protein